MTGLPKDRKALISLLRAVENIVSITDLDELLEEVLDISVDILEADRGMVFLNDAATGELAFYAGRNVDRHSIDEARDYSASLVRRAGTEDLVVVEDVQQDQGFSAYESIVRYDIRAFMCAPLRFGGKARGVIYLDSRNRSLDVDETRRSLLAAFANLAARVIETSRAHQRTETERDRLSTENEDLRRRMVEMSGIIAGDSPATARLLETIARVAPGPSSVMIEGETGTGKELVARAIHSQSARAAGPFVAVACPSIPRELIESEFFGHERGAFTGATERRLGKFELAEGGTIFLDEVGDMDFATQTKLLRAIQERSFTRVGGSRTVRVDVRILAATSRDLSEQVAGGDFREDLYYRLCVVPIRVPALRERRGDVPILARHFVERFSRIFGRRVERIAPGALELLAGHDWPGNVRQLENAIEYAMNLVPGDTIRAEHLPPFLAAVAPDAGGAAQSANSSLDAAIGELETRLIRGALEQASGNRSRAARLLGVTESRIRAKMKKHGIETRG